MMDKGSRESCRLEVEVASVLLGFIFVMESIILTMPSDVFDALKHQGFYGFLGIAKFYASDLFSLAGYYSTLMLLASIPVYFLYLKIEKRWALSIARSLLAVSIYFIVILAVLLLIGPLRKTYLEHAAFTIPATVAGVVCYLVGAHVMALAGVAPPFSTLIPLAMGLGGAVGFGESVKAWCDRTFGKNEEHRHD